MYCSEHHLVKVGILLLTAKIFWDAFILGYLHTSMAISTTVDI